MDSQTHKDSVIETLATLFSGIESLDPEVCIAFCVASLKFDVTSAPMSFEQFQDLASYDPLEVGAKGRQKILKMPPRGAETRRERDRLGNQILLISAVRKSVLLSRIYLGKEPQDFEVSIDPRRLCTCRLSAVLKSVDQQQVRSALERVKSSELIDKLQLNSFV